MSQRPLLRPAPTWAAMQKLGLPQGRPLHHRAHSPGTSAGAGRRTSAKCPPSPHPISRPPPAAEDALPNREPGAPPQPPTGHCRHTPVQSEFAAEDSQPHPNVATRPGRGHLCPNAPPPPPATWQDPTSIRRAHRWHPSLRKREIKTLPYRCPGINVPAVKTNVASSRQHLFLINAVTLP